MAFHSRQIVPATLERDTEPCCVLDPSWRILYCNPAWDGFAKANGGTAAALGCSVLGRTLTSYIPPSLRAFFRDHFHQALWGGMWSHVFECSSPAEFRLHRMQALALADSQELLVCYSQVSVRPHFRTAVEPDPRVHFLNGAVAMCSHCRRTRRNGRNRSWDWVPEFLAHPPENRLDDLCEECNAYYRHGIPPWGPSLP